MPKLSPDLTPVSLENDLMAGWMLTKSFAPHLQIRLHSTTLKLTPNPQQKSIFSTYRSIQQLGRLKQARDHLSPKIGDRWRLSLVDSHSH